MPKTLFGDCPTCGRKLPATRTVRTDVYVMRRRVCVAGCGYGIETYEIHPNRYAKLLTFEEREHTEQARERQIEEQRAAGVTLEVTHA
jgi:hypothetical protein